MDVRRSTRRGRFCWYPVARSGWRSRRSAEPGQWGRVAFSWVRLGVASGAQVLLLLFVPAEFTDACFGGDFVRALALAGIDGEFEVQLLAAAVTVHLPVVNGQLAERRAAGGGDPLAGRVDQVADFIDAQTHGQIAAALEGDQQHVARLDRAAVAGDLIAA